MMLFEYRYKSTHYGTCKNYYAHECTDYAKGMMGHNTKAIVKVKENAKHLLQSFICHIPEKMSSKLTKMLNGASEIMNCIKSQTFKSKDFKLICEVIGKHHMPLLRYRWLCRQRVFTLLMKLHAVMVVVEEP